LQLLDDAWDAAVLLMDDLCYVPPEEATQICTTLALLGSSLAYQQEQPHRAQELFIAADKLLRTALGPGCWEPWLRSLVPEPLLSAALTAWQGVDEKPTGCDGPPGLGLSSESKGSAEVDSDIDQVMASNVDLWYGAPAPMVKSSVKLPEVKTKETTETEDVEKEHPAHPTKQSPGVTEVSAKITKGSTSGYPSGLVERVSQNERTAASVGEVDVKEREGLVVVSLALAQGLQPSDVSVDASSHAVRFEAAGAWIPVEVKLPRAVDVSAAPPASYISKHNMLRLKLPAS